MSKEKAPAFQFYASDYLSDANVQLMTVEEEGCYIRLLAYCWREAFLPNNPDDLRVLCKGVEVSARVVSCFVQQGDKLIHKRLDEERAKHENWRTKSALGGRHSAHKRKHYKRKTLEQGGSTNGQADCLKGGSTLHLHLQSSISSSSSKENTIASSDIKSLSADEIFVELPCSGKHDKYPVTRNYISEMQTLYPGIDVEKETLRAKGWLVNNPQRRKTFIGITKFLGSWYSKAQNNGGLIAGRNGRSAPKKETEWQRMLQELEESEGADEQVSH